MKESFSLSIPKPCSETWDNFTPAQHGRFCNSCNKTVVDFTKMGEDEILEFISTKQNHTCGRFRSSQLKIYSGKEPLLKINPGLTLLKASLMSMLLIFMSKQTSAQTTTTKTRTEIVQQSNQKVKANTSVKQEQSIKGIVKSPEDNLPLPGVTVYLKGSVEGTYTDGNGRFEFPRKLKEGDVLVFSYIGFDSQEYVIPQNVSDVIEISMATSSVIMMGEVAVDGIYETKQSIFSKWWWKVKGLF
jgi:hypothetical protein